MFKNIYQNIGKKIKGLAIAMFIAEAVTLVIWGMVLIAIDEYLIAIGLLMVFFGPLVAWISTWLLYAFGELVDKATAIERNTRKTENKSQTQAKIDYERINRLENLRAQGLISEEEYQRAARGGFNG